MNSLPAELYTLPTINFIAGSTLKLYFNTYNKTGRAPFNLVDHDVNLSIVNYNNRTGAPFTKAMTIEEHGTDASWGETIRNVLSVTLDPNDTVDLSPGKYIYQITIKNVSGDVEPPSQGIMFISRNIDVEFTKNASES